MSDGVGDGVRDAERRTWEVVRRAYEERPIRARPRGEVRNRLLLAVTAAAVLAGAFLSSPGRAVFEHAREALGLANAEPALFSLPAPGSRLLVVAPDRGGGVWLVRADGYQRLLGHYTDARWSPHGLYVVATRENALVALTPDGSVRWTLARHEPSTPRWEGTRTDTRIAYATGQQLRVVAGDGTGDHVLDPYGGQAPPAWDPGRVHTLAYYSGGSIWLRRDDGTLVWRRPITVLPLDLEWSSDGRYLAVFSAKRVVVMDAAGRPKRTFSLLSAELLSGAFAPGTHTLAVQARRPHRSEVWELDVEHHGSERLVFAGPGRFDGIAWAPNGDWLLVTWPAADQWVFLHGSRAHAVGNIAEQFPRTDGLGPVLEVDGRWCCSG